MREESETPENAEAQQDDERGLGAEPVAVTEGAAARFGSEPRCARSFGRLGNCFEQTTSHKAEAH